MSVEILTTFGYELTDLERTEKELKAKLLAAIQANTSGSIGESGHEDEASAALTAGFSGFSEGLQG